MLDLVSVMHGCDFASLADWSHPITILAQTFEDNLGNDVSNAWNNFIESGQVWALGIGFILGYIVRGLTAY